MPAMCRGLRASPGVAVCARLACPRCFMLHMVHPPPCPLLCPLLCPPGPFHVFNCANEAACLRKWFDHMREVRRLPPGGLHRKFDAMQAHRLQTRKWKWKM